MRWGAALALAALLGGCIETAPATTSSVRPAEMTTTDGWRPLPCDDSGAGRSPPLAVRPAFAGSAEDFARRFADGIGSDLGAPLEQIAPDDSGRWALGNGSVAVSGELPQRSLRFAEASWPEDGNASVALAHALLVSMGAGDDRITNRSGGLQLEWRQDTPIGAVAAGGVSRILSGPSAEEMRLYTDVRMLTHHDFPPTAGINASAATALAQSFETCRTAGMDWPYPQLRAEAGSATVSNGRLAHGVSVIYAESSLSSGPIHGCPPLAAVVIVDAQTGAVLDAYPPRFCV